MDTTVPRDRTSGWVLSVRDLARGAGLQRELTTRRPAPAALA